MKKEAISLLYGYIENQKREISEIFRGIERIQRPKSQERVVYLGYLLHNLYCAFEDLFKEVARTFENQIIDPSVYHRELLKRMKIDIPGIRPRFLSEESHKVLDELRRFRHTFRHAYTYELDPERVKALKEELIGVWRKIESDILNFQRHFLSKLQEED